MEIPTTQLRVVPDIRLNSKYKKNSQKKILKNLVFNKPYQHLLSLSHSYFIPSEKVLKKVCHSKFASFVQQFNRISCYLASRISGYPASRISGKLKRSSGRIPDIKKGHISGQIFGQPDSRNNHTLHIYTDSCLH